MTSPQLTGRLSPDIVRAVAGRCSSQIIEGFRALPDATATISDVFDDLGMVGIVNSNGLVPRMPGSNRVGSAITVRNVARSKQVAHLVSARDNRMAEIEGINQGLPGDILVIQGLQNISNIGGMNMTIAHRQGFAGVVVDGSVRDIEQGRSLGLPVWSRGVTPVTGKWRCETVEINGRVIIDGVTVDAGDLVVADDTGICFIPRDRAAEVLALCQQAAERERHYHQDIRAGIPVAELAQRYRQKASA